MRKKVCVVIARKGQFEKKNPTPFLPEKKMNSRFVLLCMDVFSLDLKVDSNGDDTTKHQFPKRHSEK